MLRGHMDGVGGHINMLKVHMDGVFVIGTRREVIWMWLEVI